MKPECKKRFMEVIELSEKIVETAHAGQNDCVDDRSLVFFGIVLDSAYRIQQEANRNLKIIQKTKPCPAENCNAH
jgi:hypothetical protein